MTILQASLLAAPLARSVFLRAAAFNLLLLSVVITAGRDGAAAADLKELGAVGDGRADDTVAIQAAVDASIGDVQFPRGEYRISKTITIELDRVGPTSLVAAGPARLVMAGAGPAIRFVGTHRGTAGPATFQDNVWKNQRSPMVIGLEIVGAHAEADGIEATGTMQLTVNKTVIRKARHGIHLVTRNRNVLISDCHIYENSGAGIYYDQVNLHQSNIVGSHISYNSQGGIVVRGGDVRNIQIGTCDIEGNMGGPNSPPTANILLDSTGGSIGEVAVVGCTIQHSHDAPGSANIRINGESTARPFTSEKRHGNITIADNVLSDVQVNIDLQNTRGVTVTGNTVWKGYEHNLRAKNVDGLVVSNNVFDRNPRYHYGDGSQASCGLLFADSDGCTISGNHIHNCAAEPASLVVRNCRRFNITACTIVDSAAAGVLLDNVRQSRIADCLIHSDKGDQVLSIRIVRSSETMVVDNLLGNKQEIPAGAGYVAGNHPAVK